MIFLRYDVPKILVVVIASLVLIRVLRALTGKIVALHIRKVPPGFRAQQVRTLATVVRTADRQGGREFFRQVTVTATDIVGKKHEVSSAWR